MKPHLDELSGVLDAVTTTATAWHARLDDAPAAHARQPSSPAPLPPPVGAVEAMADFRRRYESQLSGSAGSRYWGFVTGAATPAGLAGDWLATAYDQNLSSDIGSAAADAEREALAWLRAILDLPDDFAGAVVTGATASNTVALGAARQWAGLRVGVNTAEDGLHAVRPRVLAGTAHASVGKALSILGIGRSALQSVPLQPGRRAVDLDAMDAALAASDAPTLVIGSAGEVNTGDFDDLDALATLCARHGAWLHVDGAFGLFARAHPALAPLARGAERADSITVDLHKWLNVPYDAGVVYCRHPALQKQVWRASASYLGDADDPMHYTPENSRRFRALSLWMTLRAYGRDGVGAWVVDNCRLARRFADGLRRQGFEVVGDVPLNIVCFLVDDLARRDRLLQRLLESGEVFLSPTVLDGRAGVRAAFSSWRTTDADVERVLAAVAAHAAG